MITTDSKKILLADDSVFFRTKLSAILIEAGHMVVSANDGKEVIKALQRGADETDILILDLQMPGIDGFAVLEWMRENGLSDKFPVLVVTGVYEPDEVITRLKELGAKGLMTKGFSPEQVLFRVNKLLFPAHAVDRGSERVPVSAPVDFTVAGETYTGFILNISTSGIFLHTRMDLNAGELIKVKFSLRGVEETITLDTSVVWSTPSSTTKTLFGGAGLKFEAVTQSDLAELKNFVESELERAPGY